MKRTLLLLVLIGLLSAPMDAFAHQRRARRGTQQSSTATTASLDDNEPEPLLGLIPVGPDDPDVFSGRVTADKRRCVGGRTVAIYKQGAANSTADTTTKSDGSWSITREFDDGTFYAFVEPRVDRERGRPRIRCLAARSNNVTAA